MNAHSIQQVASADDLQQAELDELVRDACKGDARAVGAIAVAFGPELLRTARAALGDHADDAMDVLQDFFLSMLEGHTFVPTPGRAIAWMHGIVQAIGARYALIDAEG